ncbi:hypothetical protein MNBD_GAMMA09-239 [hydrothermal vent metagenome]|uniref:Sulfotransferase domain-containing protein n=1 Tax=hydrothermal vent metagenome TaxID=652676 RepID=A0A3B0XVJ7_9ZZZZ
MKLTYITSSSFSGSTLLSFILNSNPEISTISEFDIMETIQNNPNYLCSCGDKLRECDFFNRLKNALIKEGINFKLDDMDLMFYITENERINRYLTQKIPFFNSSMLESLRDRILSVFPMYNKRISDILYRNDLFMKKVVELQKGSVFLDANKNPYRLKFLSKQHDTTAIYLYKNGIAGAYSFLKASKILDKHTISFEDACTRWFVEQITINRCINDIKSVKKINLPYSDLCKEPEICVQNICSMLNIEHSSLDNFQHAEHHIIGNVMRTSGINSIKESLDWKEKLTEQNYNIYRKIYKKYINKLSKENSSIVDNIWFEE